MFQVNDLLLRVQSNFPYIQGCLDPSDSERGEKKNADRYPGYQESFDHGDTVTYTCHKCYWGSGGNVTCNAGKWIDHVSCNFSKLYCHVDVP